MCYAEKELDNIVGITCAVILNNAMQACSTYARKTHLKFELEFSFRLSEWKETFYIGKKNYYPNWNSSSSSACFPKL
jgi:hypothetical protein